MRSIKKLLAVLMMAGLILSLSVGVFATGTEPEPDPEPEEPAPTTTVTLDKVETEIPVVLGAGENPEEAYEGHTFKAFKIMDLYQVMDGSTDPHTPLVDEDDNNVYQYKLVLADTLPEDFEALIEAEGFLFDTVTGEIKNSDGSLITSMTGINENESTASFLASIISLYIVEKGLDGVEIPFGEAKNLEAGYWVIYETASGNAQDGTVATKPILLDLRPYDAAGNEVEQRTLTLKDASVTVEKTVNDQAAVDAGIGAILPYTITATLPVYEAVVDPASVKYIITDTLSEGLTLVEDEETGKMVNVKIADIDEPEIYVDDETYWDYKLEIDGQKITVTINPEAVISYQGEAVVITYKALLNKNAIVNSEEGNKNDVTVEYTNNPGVDEGSKTVEDDATVYTYAFDLDKRDGSEENVLLAGAKFALYVNIKNDLMEYKNYFAFEKTTVDGHTVYTLAEGFNFHPNTPTDECFIITEDEDTITVKGLGPGTYYLEEIEAPAGYAKLADPIMIKIESVLDDEGNVTGVANITVDNATILVEGSDEEVSNAETATDGSVNISVVIRNYKGISLPETGSISALLVSAMGAMAALGGAVVIRKRRDEE